MLRRDTGEESQTSIVDTVAVGFFCLVLAPLLLRLMSGVLHNCLDLFNSLTYSVSTHTHVNTNCKLFFSSPLLLWRGSRVCQASHSP